MKRALMLGLICSLFLCACGSNDATAIWTQVLQKCGGSDFVGKDYLFFGISNSVGPGSGWRIANDKSIRLLFNMTQPFPNGTDTTGFVVDNQLVACSGDSTTDWDLNVSLPFSIASDSVSANLGTTLKRAQHVQVSITGFAPDLLAEIPWLTAIDALSNTSLYKTAIQQPTTVIAENAIKVTGLKATFTYDTDLSADVQASLKGKNFSVGTPAGTSTTLSAAGTESTNVSTGGAAASSATAAPGGASIASSSAASTTTDCATAAATPATSSTVNSNSGTASLHVDVISARQIQMCAAGPFYLLASYGKAILGQGLAVAPGGVAVGGVINPTTLPKGLTVTTDLMH